MKLRELRDLGEAELEAREGGELVHSQTWEREFPRGQV